MSGNYGSWSVNQLKTELRKRKARINGKKAMLVERLQMYDKIFINEMNSDIDNTYEMKLPLADEFMDLNSDTVIPKITENSLAHYSQQCNKQRDNSKNMYNEKYLLAIRSACKEEVFIHGRVASEYRKHVVYSVHVKYITDLVLECQCECAAGMGPTAHCKHVYVVLYALVHFSESHLIIVQETCTDLLQSFHKTKKYTGSPIKARNLCLRNNLKTQQLLSKWDPRQVSLRNHPNFEVNFKNGLINFAASSKVKNHVPLIEIIPPADKFCSGYDHLYVNNTPKADFLKTCYNKNQEPLDMIEAQTRNQNKSAKWIEERQFHLTSSKYGRICKSTAKTNKLKLAQSFLSYTDVRTAALHHGLKYENVAVKEFERVMNIKTVECGLFIHPDFQYLGSTPDRLVDDNAVLEVKCPFSLKDKHLSPETISYIYLDEETGMFLLDKCHDYYYQIQGQLFCTKRSLCYFCMYSFKNMLILKIERDDDFITNMLSKLECFYKECFYKEYFKKALINKYVYRPFN